MSYEAEYKKSKWSSIEEEKRKLQLKEEALVASRREKGRASEERRKEIKMKHNIKGTGRAFPKGLTPDVQPAFGGPKMRFERSGTPPLNEDGIHEMRSIDESNLGRKIEKAINQGTPKKFLLKKTIRANESKHDQEVDYAGHDAAKVSVAEFIEEEVNKQDDADDCSDERNALWKKQNDDYVERQKCMNSAPTDPALNSLGSKFSSIDAALVEILPDRNLRRQNARAARIEGILNDPKAGTKEFIMSHVRSTVKENNMPLMGKIKYIEDPDTLYKKLFEIDNKRTMFYDSKSIKGVLLMHIFCFPDETAESRSNIARGFDPYFIIMAPDSAISEKLRACTKHWNWYGCGIKNDLEKAGFGGSYQDPWNGKGSVDHFIAANGYKKMKKDGDYYYEVPRNITREGDIAFCMNAVAKVFGAVCFRYSAEKNKTCDFMMNMKLAQFSLESIKVMDHIRSRYHAKIDSLKRVPKATELIPMYPKSVNYSPLRTPNISKLKASPAWRSGLIKAMHDNHCLYMVASRICGSDNIQSAMISSGVHMVILGKVVSTTFGGRVIHESKELPSTSDASLGYQQLTVGMELLESCTEESLHDLFPKGKSQATLEREGKAAASSSTVGFFKDLIHKILSDDESDEEPSNLEVAAGMQMVLDENGNLLNNTPVAELSAQFKKDHKLHAFKDLLHIGRTSDDAFETLGYKAVVVKDRTTIVNPYKTRMMTICTGRPDIISGIIKAAILYGSVPGAHAFDIVTDHRGTFMRGIRVDLGNLLLGNLHIVYGLVVCGILALGLLICGICKTSRDTISSSRHVQDCARMCFVCGKPNSSKCTKCQIAIYCGQECQKSQWAKHKPQCVAMHERLVTCRGMTEHYSDVDVQTTFDVDSDHMKFEKFMMQHVTDIQ